MNRFSVIIPEVAADIFGKDGCAMGPCLKVAKPVEIATLCETKCTN